MVDPLTENQNDESQELSCTCGSSSCLQDYKLSFDGEETGLIPYDANMHDVKSKLEELDTIGIVHMDRWKAHTRCQDRVNLVNLINFSNSFSSTENRIACEKKCRSEKSRLCEFEDLGNGNHHCRKCEEADALEEALKVKDISLEVTAKEIANPNLVVGAPKAAGRKASEKLC